MRKFSKFTGGVSINKSKKRPPYLRISAGPLRGKYVHTLVAEAKIGRKLTRDETVEHQDGDGLNPSPDNLIVVTRPENTKRIHRRTTKGIGEYEQAQRSGKTRLDHAPRKQSKAQRGGETRLEC